jgi:BlaI family transcriptional regulator, penicillinase repressor
MRSVSRRTPLYLSRRESEVLDTLYRRGSSTAAGVLQDWTNPRRYSTVRTQLRVLELKGHIKRQKRGGLYMYSPAVPRRLARRHALRHVLETYFYGSLEEALTFALSAGSFRLENGARQRIAALCTSENVRGAAGGTHSARLAAD